MVEHWDAYAQAAEGGEASPLVPMRRRLYLMAMNSFLMRLHRDCPRIIKQLETWAGQSQFYENIDQEGFAEQYGLTVDELHAERDAAKKAWMKYRAKKLNQDRTRKHNIDEALEQWGIRTVEDTHKKLASIDKEKARLEALEKSIVSRGEHQAMLCERLAMWEAERHCRFQSELEAAIEPTIKERNKEQQTILDSKIAYHEKQAEWAQAAVARYDKKTADFAASHPTKDEQIRKQQRKIDDQDRELRTLRKQVQGYQSQQQHQKKRKRNREEERERRLMFSTHTAVSTCTPESTSKRLSVRKSRTSALARIDNVVTTNIVQ